MAEAPTIPPQRLRVAWPRAKVADFCRRWGIARLALFGSVLRDDFRPDSDVDVLVTFSPTTRYTLSDWIQMQEELERIIGRRVDLVDSASVDRSVNWYRRQVILDSAEVMYAA